MVSLTQEKKRAEKHVTSGGRIHYASHNKRREGAMTVSESLGIDDDEKLVKMQDDILAALGGLEEPEAQLEQASFNTDEIKKVCRTDLDFLAALAMPDVYQYDFSPTHHTAWQILTSGVVDSQQKFLQVALGIPRGHAKTTLIKLFILWCVLFTDRRFILITASVEKHATNILTDVGKMLDEDNITIVFGNWRMGMEQDTTAWKNFYYLGRSVILFGLGAGGSVRGTNANNQRPDLIVMDDIQTKECAESEVQSLALEDWMVGTLMKAKSQTRCLFLFAGNMFPGNNSILKKLKKNSTWVKFISGAILADGTALWEAHRSYQSLVDELENDMEMGKAYIFFAEVMNDTEIGTNAAVDYSKFPEWLWTKADMPQGKFIVIDPSTGRGKDFDVLILVEVYDLVAGVREIIEEHYSPKTLILRALTLAIQHNVFCIAVEGTAYQATLLFWFDEVCKEYGIQGINFVPLYTNMHSKNSRIASGIKAMQAKEVVLHPDVRSIVQNQISNWNPMKRDNRDDILDTVANIPKVLAEYTYEIASKDMFLVIEASGATVREDNCCF